MRRLVAAGGLAIAACVGLLLFSGAASAKQTSGDSINVIGVVTGMSPSGTNVQITAAGSAFDSLYFSGGTNYQFSAASGAAWTCNLTPTNRGAACWSSTPATSYTLNAIISGTLPPFLTGLVGFADTTTAMFTAPISMATLGKPTVTDASVKGVTKGKPRLRFDITKGNFAPPIKALTVELPKGALYLGSAQLLDKFMPPTLHCSKLSKREFACKAKQPLDSASVTVKHPPLMEWRPFETAVKKHKVKRVTFVLTVKDASGAVTPIHLEIPVH